MFIHVLHVKHGKFLVFGIFYLSGKCDFFCKSGMGSNKVNHLEQNKITFNTLIMHINFYTVMSLLERDKNNLYLRI